MSTARKRGGRKRLDGKVAIITGGGRGIGRAIAETLAEHGAKVAVTARTRAEILETVRRIESKGGRAIAVAADVSDEKHVQRVVGQTKRRLGPTDILVNNAGHPGAFKPLWKSDPDEWWRTLEVNLRGPMLCSRAVLPSMISRKRGVIVNIGSYIGIRASPEDIAYSTSKCALVRLTDGLAASVAKYGIQVFVLSPGMVRTKMMSLVPEDIIEGMSDSEWSPPEAAARFVLRMACGEARALSGRFIHVDDDLDELVRNSRRIRRDNLYTLRLLKLTGAED